MEGGRVPPILSLDASSSWASMEIRIQERVGMYKQEEAGPQTPLSPTTSKLPREDMSIYGSLPSRDPIQLVVCKWCGRTVKDTAMLRHQELHHSSTKDTPILLNKITHSHSYNNKSTVVKEQKVEKKKKGSKGKDHHYDPDRHCGVWLVDEKRNCLRSLTCKYHSLSLRRQVKDRSKPFDELLMLHREQKKGKSSSPTVNSQPTIIAQATSARTSDNVQVSTLVDSTTLPSHQPLTVFAEMWVEESDEEEKDSPIHSSETGALPQSNSHPKPLACCKWRTRTAGGGHLLFNRRQDQLYSSLLRLATGTTEDSNTNSTTVAHRKHVFSLLHDELELRKSIISDHSLRNNFHTPSVNSMELTLGTTTYSGHGRQSSAVPATVPAAIPAAVPPQSIHQQSDGASFQFSCPKGGLPKGQHSSERRNSLVAPSTPTTPKTPKQPRKRRRSSVEQTSPVVNSSKSNDALVSPILVDGLKDMPQPFVSLTDMNFHLGSIPTSLSALQQLHQPANHQVQDFKNCVTFSGNTFDNEQHPAMPQFNKDSHKTANSDDNLNSMINKMVQHQSSPSIQLPQHMMINGTLATSPGGGLMTMPPPPAAAGPVSGNLLTFHPSPAKLSPHNMVPFNPGNLAVSSHQILPGSISSLPYHEAQGDKSSNSVTLQRYLQQQIASGQMINFNQRGPFLLTKPTSYHPHSFTALGPDSSNTNFNNNTDTRSQESMLQYAAESYTYDDKQSELSLFDSKNINILNPISDQQQVT